METELLIDDLISTINNW